MISTTSNRITHSANGSSTEFTYPFRLDAATSLNVYFVDVNNVAVLQSSSTYTVSGVGNDNGGYITFTTAPASGQSVLLLRSTVQVQSQDYIPNGRFPSESHEDALDLLTQMVQDLQDQVDRSIKFELTESSVPQDELPPRTPGMSTLLVGYNENGVTTTGLSIQFPDDIASYTSAQLGLLDISATPVGTIYYDTDIETICIVVDDGGTKAYRYVELGFDTALAVTNFSNGKLVTGQHAHWKGYHSAGDGGGGRGFITSDSDDGSHITTTGGQDFRQIFEDKIFNIRRLGAKGDGVNDDHVALENAFKLAGAGGGGTIRVPAGTYKMNGEVDVRPAGFVNGSSITIKGDGHASSVFKRGANGFTLFASLSGSGAEHYRFDAVAFEGLFSADNTSRPDDRFTLIRDCAELEFLFCRGENGAGLGISGEASRVHVIGGYYFNNSRDPVQFAEAQQVIIKDVTITECGDDALSLHISSAGDLVPWEASIVQGCRFEMTQGVKALGGINLIAQGNVFTNCKGYFFNVGQDSTFGEGYTSIHSLIFDSNVCTNLFDLDDFVPGASSFSGIYIGGNPSSGGAGTGSYGNYSRGVGRLDVSGVGSDGETVTIGSDVYELDTNSSVGGGNIAVNISGGTSSSEVITALLSAINNNGTESVRASRFGRDCLTIYSTDSTGAALATTETGANMSWGNSTMQGSTGIGRFDGTNDVMVPFHRNNDWRLAEYYSGSSGSKVKERDVTIAPNSRIKITNNILAQQLDYAEDYDDLGFNSVAMHNDGPEGTYEVDIMRQGTGMVILNSLIDSEISGNTFTGWEGGIRFSPSSAITEQVNNLWLHHNKFLDCINGVGNTTNNKVNGFNIVCEDNFFDLDPYLQESIRSDNGTWTSYTTTQGCPFVMRYVEGFILRRNTYMNCAQAYYEAGSSEFCHTEPTYIGEITTSSGSTTGHKGVGSYQDVLQNGTIIEVGSNPTDANYRRDLDNIVDFRRIFSSNSPTSQWLPAGTFVWNNGSTNSKLLGWRKMRTGTGTTTTHLAHSIANGDSWSPTGQSATNRLEFTTGSDYTDILAIDSAGDAVFVEADTLPSGTLAAGTLYYPDNPNGGSSSFQFRTGPNGTGSMATISDVGTNTVVHEASSGEYGDFEPIISS